MTTTIDTNLITRLLQDMVRINSVNPGLDDLGAGEGRIAAWIADVCRSWGLEVELQATGRDRPNVIARWRGAGGGQSVLLTGHTDTVSLLNMEGDPLDGRIEGDRLYGRGAYDMKGGLAAILGAVEALRRGGFQPHGDVILGFVTDEEYLSIGMDALVQRVKADAAILTEPTELQLCIAHKGFAWVNLVTQGLATHGSLYEDGIDAIAHMGRLLSALERMERDIFPARQHPLLGRASAHASMISGGLGLSTYPDRARLQVEHRLLPDQTDDDALNWWRREIDALHAADPRFQAEVELEFYRPGYEIALDAPIVQTVQRAATTITGQAPEIYGMWAWLDSAILGRSGIPTVILGPGGEGAHAAVEWVSLSSVFDCARILADAAQQWTA
jgi:acetylornithine deacetylase